MHLVEEDLRSGLLRRANPTENSDVVSRLMIADLGSTAEHVGLQRCGGRNGCLASGASGSRSYDRPYTRMERVVLAGDS